MKKTARVFALVLALCMSLTVLTGAALAAGSLRDQSTWEDYKAQAAPYDSSANMAKKLSGMTGGSISNKDGAKFPTVVVEADSKMYVSGRETTLDTHVNITSTDPNTGYKLINLATKTPQNADAKVNVYVFNGASDQDLQKVTSSISAGLLSQAGVAPDTGTAMGLLSGIMPMINTLLGLIVTVISIGMTVFSALDIIYLAFPAFRGTIDNQVEGGGKGTKTNKDGSKSSRFVTDDARTAVAESSQNQQQPWGRYFKRRIIAYIFLAIILFILLTGNIFSITTLVTNALSGLFGSLGIG
ncbi:hypothetical protein FACS1894208_00250 [Clostridia bacterium]|nr:hypothetical protein FACS1894208_00250 [Clostridia bacterium]